MPSLFHSKVDLISSCSFGTIRDQRGCFLISVLTNLAISSLLSVALIWMVGFESKYSTTSTSLRLEMKTFTGFDESFISLSNVSMRAFLVALSHSSMASSTKVDFG